MTNINKPEQTAMNTSGTETHSDTPLTRKGSWIVRDRDDNPWGPFDSAIVAAEWATKKWPDVPPWSEDLDPDNCWDVVALWSPEP